MNAPRTTAEELIRKLRSELDTVTAERDVFRQECVALVNDCIVAPDRLSAQGGEVPEWDVNKFANHIGIEGAFSAGDIRVFFAGAKACHEWIRANHRPTAPHPDTVVVCEWHPGDIPGTGVRGWKTSCGEAMYPKHRWRIGEDGLNFCPNCGKRAVQVTDDEWDARSTQAQPATEMEK